MQVLTQIHGFTGNELLTKIEELIDKKLEVLANKTDPNEKLSREQLSLELGVTVLTIDNWAKKGLIKKNKIGRRVYFLRRDVESALQGYKSLKYQRTA